MWATIWWVQIPKSKLSDFSTVPAGGETMIEENGEETPQDRAKGSLYELATAGLGQRLPAAGHIPARRLYFRRRCSEQRGNSTAADRPKLRDIPQNNWPVFIKNTTKDKERPRSSSRLKQTKGNVGSWIFCYYKEHYWDSWGSEWGLDRSPVSVLILNFDNGTMII